MSGRGKSTAMVGVLGLGIGVNVYGTYYVLAQTGTLSPDFLPTPANLAWARAKLGLDAPELPPPPPPAPPLETKPRSWRLW